MPPKVRTEHRCVHPGCDWTGPKWQGQCPKCKEWGTVNEAAGAVTGPGGAKTGASGLRSSLAGTAVALPAQRVRDIDLATAARTRTGIGEFDRILGGGLVPGGVILLAGEPGVGKALALDTPLSTPNGWTTMGHVQPGDLLLDRHGQPTKVLAATEVLTGRDCYRLGFSDGSSVVADADHQWVTVTADTLGGPECVKTTREIAATYRSQHAVITQEGVAFIVSCVRCVSVPVRCVQVDNPDQMYLAGLGRVPTHNSTLLLDVANRMAASGPVLYVSGEESRAQIRLRAERTGAAADDLWIADESDLGTIIGHLDEVRPILLIVDSVQTVASGDIDGSAGGISQVKEVSAALTKVAKNRGLPTILVGQATKTGDAAGPNALMHIVDAVFLFEGEEHSALRLIRAMKNRFGSADDVACFQMTGSGIEEVPDPSGLFLTARDEPVPGTCVTIVMEGRRAMPAEVQALVTPSPLAQPRRGVSGLDKPRVDMLIAVVQSQAKLKLWERDVFMATIAGQKIAEPAADLAGVLALVSAYTDTPLPSDVVALGEVALSGDIRAVSGLARRLDEAKRLGFKRAFVPPGAQTQEYRAANPHGGLTLIEVANVARAVQAVSSSPAAR